MDSLNTTREAGILKIEKGVIITGKIQEKITVEVKLLSVNTIRSTWRESDVFYDVRCYDAYFNYDGHPELHHKEEFRTLFPAGFHIQQLKTTLFFFKDEAPLEKIKEFLSGVHAIRNDLWAKSNGEIGKGASDVADQSVKEEGEEKVNSSFEFGIIQHLKNFSCFDCFLKSMFEFMGSYSIVYSQKGFIRYEISSRLFRKIYAYITLKPADNGVKMVVSFQTIENDGEFENQLFTPASEERKFEYLEKKITELQVHEDFFLVKNNVKLYIEGTNLKIFRKILSIFESQDIPDTENCEIFEFEKIYYCAQYSALPLHTTTQLQSNRLVSIFMDNLMVNADSELNDLHLKAIEKLVNIRNRVYNLSERNHKSCFTEMIEIDESTTIHQTRSEGEKAKGIHAISRFIYGEESFLSKRCGEDGPDIPQSVKIEFVKIHEKPRLSIITWISPDPEHWSFTVEIFPKNFEIEQKWMENCDLSQTFNNNGDGD